MQNVISGYLNGIDENHIQVRYLNGEIKAYPYNGLDELDIDLQWVYENTGCSVICLLKNGVITEIKPLARVRI